MCRMFDHLNRPGYRMILDARSFARCSDAANENAHLFNTHIPRKGRRLVDTGTIKTLNGNSDERPTAETRRPSPNAY